MINGGFTGGSTNGGSGSFKVEAAFLVNVIASSADIAESLGMTKLVLAGLELGGVIGSLLGVATLLLCVTLFVLAVEEYKANVDNMFAYMSGDESAGDAIVVNAGINLAVTAAFSGASYLAKKQLAKYATKQVTDKLGEELAERLLKDGADSTVIAKAVRSLEKSGVDNALIRKAAAQMTAEEFERIGALAKRGLAGELLEKVVDNRAVLGQVSDSTLLLLRSSKSSADDIITVLLRHGDEAGRLYGQYGDDVIEIALRYGDEGLGGIKRHGTDFLIEYFAYGDEFAQNYMKYGDEAVETYIKYGDDAAKLLADKRVFNSLNTETIKNIRKAILNNGLSDTDFLIIMRKSSMELTREEAAVLEDIRNVVPLPNETTELQKVVDPLYVQGYLDGSFMNHGDGKITGFITKVDDVRGLNTPQDIFEGLRLDYDGTRFSPTDSSVTVIRFTTEETENIMVPFGDGMPNPSGGKISELQKPFTGHGFTAAENGQVIPEFYSYGLTLNDGAQMLEIPKDGPPILIAIYSKKNKKFMPIN